MSIVVHGELEEALKLLGNLLSYKCRCLGENFTPVSLSFPSKYPIKTKYFDLHVDIHHLNTALVPNAVILIAPRKELIKADMSYITRLKDDTAKMLIVYLDDENDTTQDEYRSDRIEWCLDHSFEYIEVFLDNITKGWNDRDKDGFPRIVESLENIMWSGPSAAAVYDEIDRFEVDPVPAETEEPPVQDESKTSSISSVNKADSVTDEVLVDQVECIFEQVKKQRALVDSGKLNDVDRRATAERMALELCKLLNLDESGSDSD